jgi:hypothetical protein
LQQVQSFFDGIRYEQELAVLRLEQASVTQ